LIRADLHVHTHYSVDSFMSPEKLVETCLKKGINCVAVADHGTTKGGRDVSKIAPFKVIICEEIMTPYGEVMGLFLQEDIPNKLSLDETIKRIREQGGLICIPHPFDRVRPSAFRNTAVLASIIDQVDIVEVFNARSLFPGIEKKAAELAHKYHKYKSAGTDAHSPLEIGYVHVEMDDFNTKEEYLDSLSKGKIYAKKSSPLIHIISSTARLTKHKK